MRAALILICFCFCVPLALPAQKLRLIDKSATAETKALFINLHKLSKHHTLFGHQHALEYGHGWEGDADRSDVKSVTGSHPAVDGIDLGGFTNINGAAAENYKLRLKNNVDDFIIEEEWSQQPGIFQIRFQKEDSIGWIRFQNPQ